MPLYEITEKDRVDIIMTNPPFGGEEEKGIMSNFPESTRTSETALLFLQYIMRKLKNSGNEYKSRIKSGVIDWFVQMKANFKFVIDTHDDIDEVNLLVKEFGIPKSQVYLMPQGKTRDEQWNKMDNIIMTAKINGYNFSPRFHVLMYSDKRGV